MTDLDSRLKDPNPMPETKYVKIKCQNCDREMTQPKWLVDKYDEEDESIFCSGECRYNYETGHPGEEY